MRNMVGRYTPALVALIVMLFALTVEAQVRYSVVEREDARFLMAFSGTTAQEVLSDDYVQVVKTADFDGDGSQDALVQANCIGSGCDSSWYFVSARPSGLVKSKLGSSYGDAIVRRLGNGWVVDVEDSNGRRTFRFDGQRAVKVASVTTPSVKAVSEIHGTHAYTHEGQTRTLDFDLDLDGRNDRIFCTIWPKWGTLDCEVRLATGYKQGLVGTSCERLGVLSSTTSGRHDLVCNRDNIYRFRAGKWQ